MANGNRRGLVLGAALVLSWVGFVATVLWRPEHGVFHAWFDAGAYNLPFVLSALACFVRAAQEHRARAGWRILGLAFATFTAGNLYGSLVVGDRDIYPSPADGLWLLFYVLMYLAIVHLVKARMARFLPSLWLDGAVGGLGAASLAAALVLQPVLTQTQGSVPVVLTNLAYPVADILLVTFLVTAWTAMGTRNPSWWLFAAGVVVLCVGDIRFLFAEAADAYVEGGLLDITWPLSAVLVGLAACVRQSDRVAAEEVRGRILVPAVFTLTSVGLLVYGQGRTLPVGAVVLTVAALAVASGRVLLTMREVAALANSRREARTDDLTGLANRRRLLEYLAEQMSDPAAVTSLLIMDLDRFKEVNDSLGHGAGDALLQAIGRRLAPVVGAPGLLARLGGDEFAAVLPRVPLDEAIQIARSIAERLDGPFSISGRLLPVEASIGVASSPEHGDTAETLMSAADIAMYRAKRQRTRVEPFQPVLDQPSIGRMTLLGELHTALAERQLTLWYQPQLDLATGQVCGVEALIRWPNPDRGLVPPDLFLPLAEQSNLMATITAFVLDQALADCAWLRDSGCRVRMSVNVSATDLIDSALPGRVVEDLRRHRIEPDALVLEVTEDTVLADRARALKVLHQLREAGVNVSVDDYGTGHSSLSYLRDLPISELKLDRSFLLGVPGDTHNAAIVRSTVELAHALNLPIVGEGVEDVEALSWLRGIGCDIGQGFHICPPLPRHELRAWLQSSDRAAALGYRSMSA